MGAVFCLGFFIYWGFSSSLLSEPAALVTFNQMGREWIMIAGGSFLTIVVLLRLAGDAAGSVTDNGAVLARLLLLPGWAAVLVPGLRGEEEVFVGYLWVLGLLSLAVFAWHLGELRVFEAHLRPFWRAGLAGRVASIFLIPNWVGGLWILPLAVGVLLSVVAPIVFQTFLLLFGAFLASGVFLWRACFPKVRNLFGLFALHAVIGGLASAVSFALQAKLESRWLSFMPAFGFWRYAGVQSKTLRDDPTLLEWRMAASAAFLAYLIACATLAVGWVRREVWPVWRKR